MPAGTADHLMHRLRRTVLFPNGGGLTDGQLLDGFITRRDEAAFEALVRRHGPMVLGVCRRVIGHEADAEDAFQAAFLVLVRRAASIVPREKVGNWLYGVAYRTALEARTMLIRRRNIEKQVTDVVDSRIASQVERQELAELLDRELTRLPDKYRLPVVLCELEGRSRKEVALQLGLPEGTLSSRLATARKMLARRLKGLSEPEALAPGGFAALTGLTPPAQGTEVPSSLLKVTVETATALAKGGAHAAGLVSAKVVSLAEGVSKAMFLAKLKMTAVVVLTIFTAGIGVGLLTVQGLADQTGEPKNQEAAQPVAKADNPPSDKDPLQGTWMLVAREEEGKRRDFPQGVGIFLIFDRGTMTTREEPVGLFAQKSGSMTDSGYTLPSDENPKAIDLVYLNGPKKGQPWKRGIYFLGYGNDLQICWGDEVSRPTKLDTTDSKWVLNVFRRVEGSDGKPAAERSPEKWKVRLDLDTGHSQPVSSVAFSPDGKMLATGSLDKTVKLWDVASGKVITTLEMSLPVTFIEFSPDGKTLAAVETEPDQSQPGEVTVRDASTRKLSVWEVSTRKLRFWWNRPGGQINCMAFSPDGRFLAIAGMDKAIRLLDASSGKMLREFSERKIITVTSVKFSPDGQTLASASLNATVKLWDPASGKEIRRLQVPGGVEGAAHRAGVRAVRFTPDGIWIVTAGEDKALNFWDAITGKLIEEYYGQDGGVLALEVSPDGKTLALVGGQTNQSVVILNIEPRKELGKLTGHQNAVKSIAFSPDGKALAVGDGTHLKLWSRESLQPPTK